MQLKCGIGANFEGHNELFYFSNGIENSCRTFPKCRHILFIGGYLKSFSKEPHNLACKLKVNHRNKAKNNTS